MPAEVNTMMFAGEKPWHGLGTYVGDQEVTAKEAIVHAGLDWKVTLRPVHYQTLEGERVGGQLARSFKLVDNKKAVVRADTGVALGIVSPRYVPLQNRDAFSFFDAVVREKAAIYHTAGALKQGETIWILAKLPGQIRIEGTDDITDQYLLLHNSHDGTAAVRMKMTPIRVVCANTLAVALSNYGDQKLNNMTAWARHTGKMGDRVKEFRDKLGLVNDWYLKFGEEANALARVQVPRGNFLDEYIQDVGIPKEIPSRKRVEEGEKPEMKPNPNHEAVQAAFEKGRGNDMRGIKRTWWAAYNALAEFVDHDKKTRKGRYGSERESRWASQILGDGHDMKLRAWSKAKEYAGLVNVS